jgi:moderate conductance mechanosensitive channel
MMDLPEMPEGEFILQWLMTGGLRSLIIIILAWITYELIYRLIRQAITRLQALDNEENSAFDKRVETIFSVIKRTLLSLIIVTAILLVLNELGADVTPLLASVGIVGLALGLGAQSLVRDIIGGLFILLEDQYRVGDAVELGGKIGVVELMTLRATRLRDFHGILHIIPNGDVRVVSNRAHEWSRAVIDVGVTYEDDLDKATRILDEIGQELLDHLDYGPLILEPPAVLGVNALADWCVQLRMTIKTLPNQQHALQRYVYRQIRERFAAEGVTLALPRQEMIVLPNQDKGIHLASRPAGSEG